MYNNESFPVSLLIMFGAKTTSKDRGRQELPDAI